MNVLSTFLSHPTVERIGWVLLHFLWQGAVIAAVLGIALLVLRRRSANLKYAVCCSALVLMILAAFATFFILHEPEVVEPLPVVSVETIEIEPMDAALPVLSPTTLTPSVTPPIESVPLPAPLPIPLRERALTFIQEHLGWFTAAWALGVLLLSLRLLAGYIELHLLKRLRVRTVSASVEDRLKRIAARVRVSRPVRLIESAVARAPMAVGWLRPVILLPTSALAGLTPNQLEAILAHELAHIRRYDNLVNLVQTLVETLLFYHPAVHWVSHRIRVEREHCCDDIAVAACGNSTAYARALARIAELHHDKKYRVAAAASGGSLLGRVRRLLGVHDTSSGKTSSWIVGIIVIISVLLFFIYLHQLNTSTPGETEVPNEANLIEPADEETPLVADADIPENAGPTETEKPEETAAPTEEVDKSSSKEEFHFWQYDVSDLLVSLDRENLDNRETRLLKWIEEYTGGPDEWDVVRSFDPDNPDDSLKADNGAEPARLAILRNGYLMVHHRESTHKDVKEVLARLREACEGPLGSQIPPGNSRSTKKAAPPEQEAEKKILIGGKLEILQVSPEYLAGLMKEQGLSFEEITSTDNDEYKIRQGIPLPADQRILIAMGLAANKETARLAAPRLATYSGKKAQSSSGSADLSTDTTEFSFLPNLNLEDNSMRCEIGYHLRRYSREEDKPDPTTTPLDTYDVSVAPTMENRGGVLILLREPDNDAEEAKTLLLLATVKAYIPNQPKPPTVAEKDEAENPAVLANQPLPPPQTIKLFVKLTELTDKGEKKVQTQTLHLREGQKGSIFSGSEVPYEAATPHGNELKYHTVGFNGDFTAFVRDALPDKPGEEIDIRAKTRFSWLGNPDKRAHPYVPEAEEWETTVVLEQGIPKEITASAADAHPPNLKIELTARVLTEAEKRIEAALEKKVSGDFVDAYLQDVMEYFRMMPEFEKVNFILDNNSLADQDVLIAASLQDVTLKSALNTILQPRELEYVIWNDAILISTKERLKELTAHTLYIPPNPRKKEKELLILLEKKLSCNFANISLQKALEYVKTLPQFNNNVNFIFDDEVFRNREVWINTSLRDIPLRCILNIILLPHELDYAIWNDAIFISTPERIEELTGLKAPKNTAGLQAAPTADNPLSFGPVIQTIVNDDSVGTHIFIDLDTGKLFTPPADIASILSPEKTWWTRIGHPPRHMELLDWIRRNGIDAVADVDGYGGGKDLFVFDLLSTDSDESWETASPDSVTAAIRKRVKYEKGPIARPPRLQINGYMNGRGNNDTGAPFVFRTREGGIGILQIMARIDNPKGVKIRYKMVIPPWGEAVDGVQVRLRADKPIWQVGETPSLKADLRNTGKKSFLFAPDEAAATPDLELDGKTYRWVGPSAGLELSDFPPMQSFNNVTLTVGQAVVVANGHVEDSLDLWATADGVPLKVGPGKHVVRVTFPIRRAKTSGNGMIRVTSNPVEITIEPKLPGSKVNIEEALSGPEFAFAAVCKAQNDGTCLVTDLGTENWSQSFGIVDLLAGKAPDQKEFEAQYISITSPPRFESHLEKGQHAILIVHSPGPNVPHFYRITKVLPDTPENRETIKESAEDIRRRTWRGIYEKDQQNRGEEINELRQKLVWPEEEMEYPDHGALDEIRDRSGEPLGEGEETGHTSANDEPH